MSADRKHVQDRISRDELNARLQEMERKHNAQIEQLKAEQAQANQDGRAPAAQPQPRVNNDELMNKLRKDGIKSYFERASRSWDQGAYDPQGQFWMQFWDFLFNSITEVLLRAGYIDPNKIATGLVDDIKEQVGHEKTPQSRPPIMLRKH